jgi:hypothetical protein
VGYKVAAELHMSLLPRRSASPEQGTAPIEVHAIDSQAEESACRIARKDLFVLDTDWPPGAFPPRCARCDELVRARTEPT